MRVQVRNGQGEGVHGRRRGRGKGRRWRETICFYCIYIYIIYIYIVIYGYVRIHSYKHTTIYKTHFKILCWQQLAFQSGSKHVLHQVIWPQNRPGLVTTRHWACLHAFLGQSFSPSQLQQSPLFSSGVVLVHSSRIFDHNGDFTQRTLHRYLTCTYGA